MSGVSAETIAQQGRWASFTSLTRYLTAGRARVLATPLSTDSELKITLATNRFWQHYEAKVPTDRAADDDATVYKNK